jgi:hypothetical protein
MLGEKYAKADFIEAIDSRDCLHARFSDDGKTVICNVKRGGDEVMQARAGERLSKSESARTPAVSRAKTAQELHLISDADFRLNFIYTRWLMDVSGKRVGIVLFEGWENTETNSQILFTSRYNMRGELVSVSER